MKNSYQLKQPLNDIAKEFIVDSIERSFNTETIEINDKMICVDFKDEISEDTYKEQIEKLLYISQSLSQNILFKNEPEQSCYEDPMPNLLKSQDVIRVDNGTFLFQGNFFKLFQHYNEYWRKIAFKYNAREQEYPVLWPVSLYRDINYFSEFPQQIIMATSVIDSFKEREEFAQKYEKSNDYDSVDIDKHFAPSQYGLQNAVCDICYYVLKNTKNFKNTVYTTYNKVFRNEYSRDGNLDRLMNYSVRDIMFVGDQKFVMYMREKMFEEVIDFLKQLDLFSIIQVANDPFFCNESVMKNMFQFSYELKHEILARINHTDRNLAIGSVNLHQDFFGYAFNIQLPDGSEAWSGCLGIGFERLIYILYCQFGTDLSKWPDSIRETVMA